MPSSSRSPPRTYPCGSTWLFTASRLTWHEDIPLLRLGHSELALTWSHSATQGKRGISSVQSLPITIHHHRMCLQLAEHLQTSLPHTRAEHRALIPPKQIKAEQELLQKLMHTFLISYCNKSLLPLRTDFLPLLLMLTGHLPPKQSSTTCLGGMMVSIYLGHSHHFQLPLNRMAPGGNALCSQRRAPSSAPGWGVGMGRSCPSCRGALCRGGCQLSSPFLCCREQTQEQPEPVDCCLSWCKAMPGSSMCQAAVGEWRVRRVGS